MLSLIFLHLKLLLGEAFSVRLKLNRKIVLNLQNNLKENSKLRATSFELFSILSNFLNDGTLSKYKHQVEDCFIQIVLHLFDNDHSVVKVSGLKCSYA